MSHSCAQLLQASTVIQLYQPFDFRLKMHTMQEVNVHPSLSVLVQRMFLNLPPLYREIAERKKERYLRRQGTRLEIPRSNYPTKRLSAESLVLGRG